MIQFATARFQYLQSLEHIKRSDVEEWEYLKVDDQWRAD